MKQNLLFLWIMAFAAVVWAQDTREVCASCDYTRIQEAVDAAAPGDIIRVLEDTGEQNINIGKELTLVYHLTPFEGPKPFECGDDVVDIDGNTYRTVSVGDQCWMAENLRVSRYNNEEDIPTGLDDTEWENTAEGAYAIYPHSSIDGLNSDEEVLEAYGALYNWYAVDDARGFCPEGWSVPSDADWTQLVDYVADQGFPNESANINGAGNALKSCRQVGSLLEGCNTSEHPRWNPHGTHSGFDEFEFSALPGGSRWFNGSFYDVGNYLGWWSGTEGSHGNAWFRFIYGSNGNVNRSYINRSRGFSVRCIKD